MPRGAFTAARTFRFDNAEIAAGVGFQLAEELAGEQRFTPQAVHIGRSSDADEESAGYASIDGYLVGENEKFRKVWRVVTRIPVGLAFRCIYNTADTTARDITALEEV
ncbi:MAG: hypothetical protein WC449_05880 [Candidatus Paceibacterota bacterium]